VLCFKVHAIDLHTRVSVSAWGSLRHYDANTELPDNALFWAFHPLDLDRFARSLFSVIDFARLHRINESIERAAHPLPPGPVVRRDLRQLHDIGAARVRYVPSPSGIISLLYSSIFSIVRTTNYLFVSRPRGNVLPGWRLLRRQRVVTDEEPASGSLDELERDKKHSRVHRHSLTDRFWS
jgi:hypothetical protein